MGLSTEATVLLAGTGRSGTTWVGDVINHHNDFRVLFEPFHSRLVRVWQPFHYRQYLRPGTVYPQLEEAVENILSGRVRSPWSDRFNRRILARRRLVKEIRINLMLGWIRERYPDLPIILLVRHPGAVAMSKLQLGWKTILDELLAQPDLVEEHLLPQRSLLESVQNDFGRHIALWCVETLVPLRQLKPGDFHLVFYEHLVTQPKNTVPLLLRYAGIDDQGFDYSKLGHPSAMAQKSSAIKTGRDVLGSWHRNVDVADLEQMHEILCAFGLQNLYDRNYYPASEPGTAAVRPCVGVK
ncbi:MAG: sulfotransferase [Gammaproteobacteria bacterium]|nr:sulfotransferase [Gammaproteobacteria bacterium]